MYTHALLAQVVLRSSLQLYIPGSFPVCVSLLVHVHCILILGQYSTKCNRANIGRVNSSMLGLFISFIGPTYIGPT